MQLRRKARASLDPNIAKLNRRSQKNVADQHKASVDCLIRIEQLCRLIEIVSAAAYCANESNDSNNDWHRRASLLNETFTNVLGSNLGSYLAPLICHASRL
jgi:hypothetical protein